MKKDFIVVSIIIVLIVVIATIYYFVNLQQAPIVDNINNPNNNTNDVQKIFAITAKNFAYDPVEIRVKQNDKIKIILNNTEGFHDFVINEFNVKTEQKQSPIVQEIEFIADKVGTFEFYCSVGNHRQMGMVGKLIVE